MKSIFVFFFLMVAFASAAPAPDDKPVFQTIRQSFDLEPAGSYKFDFETENKIAREETGELKTIKDEEGKDHQVVVVKGSYMYEDADGNVFTVNYYADETGFHPEGAHLPSVPGVGAKS